MAHDVADLVAQVAGHPHDIGRLSANIWNSEGSGRPELCLLLSLTACAIEVFQCLAHRGRESARVEVPLSTNSRPATRVYGTGENPGIREPIGRRTRIRIDERE